MCNSLKSKLRYFQCSITFIAWYEEMHNAVFMLYIKKEGYSEVVQCNMVT